MKQNVIVFDTGSYFQKKKKYIYDKYNVLAFADNDVNVQNTVFEGKKVISPEKI